MALLTIKETSDVLGMSLKSVEDLMNSDKNGTKFKSKIIGKKRYVEIKPTALNYYRTTNNVEYEDLLKENTNLKKEIKSKEFQVGELISIVREQTLALPKPKKSFLEYFGFIKNKLEATKKIDFSFIFLFLNNSFIPILYE